jgi:hypothetical protein
MSRPPLLRRLACLGAAGALLLAMLACSDGGPGPNAAATVEALNRYVQETLAAQTSLPPAPPTETWEPTLQPIPRNTATLPPVAQASPTPPPTVPAPTGGPSPTPIGLSRPNGPILHAVYAPAPPTIDGHLNEWNPMVYSLSEPVYKPENRVDSNDNSATFNLAWNQQFLFLAAVVLDDVHVQTQRGELIFKGDSLEILLDADLAGDFTVDHLNADDFQLGLSPGALNGDTPEAHLWYPAGRAGLQTAVQLAAQPDGQGYRLEAAIPWQLFNITPAGNARYGFVLSASDNDSPGTAEQQSLITTVSTRKLLDPTTWGALALDQP